jgi:hypothetical protein
MSSSNVYEKGSSQISSSDSIQPAITASAMPSAAMPAVPFQDALQSAQAIEGKISSEMSKASSEIAAKRSPIMNGLSIVLSLATIGVAVYLLMEMQKKSSA